MTCKLAYFGDDQRLKQVMASPEYCFDADPQQKTPLHYALEGRHGGIESGSMKGNHERCINMLASDPRTNLTLWCPIVDALHLRNTIAIKSLAKHMSDEELRECLWEINIDGDTVLHFLARSKANGFGRFFIRHIVSRKADMPQLPSMLKILQVDSNSTLAMQSRAAKHVSLQELEAALPPWDMRFVLKTAARVGMGDDRSWLEHRNQRNHTALLIACVYARPKVVRLLLKHGADARAADSFGRTCAHLVTTGGEAMAGGRLREKAKILSALANAGGDSAGASERAVDSTGDSAGTPSGRKEGGVYDAVDAAGVTSRQLLAAHAVREGGLYATAFKRISTKAGVSISADETGTKAGAGEEGNVKVQIAAGGGAEAGSNAGVCTAGADLHSLLRLSPAPSPSLPLVKGLELVCQEMAEREGEQGLSQGAPAGGWEAGSAGYMQRLKEWYSLEAQRERRRRAVAREEAARIGKGTDAGEARGTSEGGEDGDEGEAGGEGCTGDLDLDMTVGLVDEYTEGVLPAHRFDGEYLSLRPVVIRAAARAPDSGGVPHGAGSGAAGGASVGGASVGSSILGNWAARRHWTRDEVTKRYGKLDVEAGRIPYAQSYGHADVSKLPLSEYVAYHMSACARLKEVTESQQQSSEQQSSKQHSSKQGATQPFNHSYVFDSSVLHRSTALLAEVGGASSTTNADEAPEEATIRRVTPQPFSTAVTRSILRQVRNNLALPALCLFCRAFSSATHTRDQSARFSVCDGPIAVGRTASLPRRRLEWACVRSEAMADVPACDGILFKHHTF
jgi:hypothetical protein